MSLVKKVSDLYRQGSEVGDWSIWDEEDEREGSQALFLGLTATPKAALSTDVVRNGRVRWDTILRGCPKVTYVPGWESRGMAIMDPVCLLHHWTAGKPSAKNPAPSLNVCIKGRKDVPGPLVHLLVGTDGTIYVICSGKGNHGGGMHKALLSRMAAGLPPQGTARQVGLPDTGSANSRMLGVEIENDGTAPFSKAQVNSMSNIHKALLFHTKIWTEAQVKGWMHANITTRKVDITGRKWPL